MSEQTDNPEGSGPEHNDLIEAVDRLVRHGGLRLSFPDSIKAAQLAWPEDAPLTEPELRREVQALYDDVKAVQDRATKLHARLPEVTSAEINQEAPQSLYYVLNAAVHATTEDFDRFYAYLEEMLSATPDSLLLDWVSYLLSWPLSHQTLKETEDRLPQLLQTLLRHE